MHHTSMAGGEGVVYIVRGTVGGCDEGVVVIER